MGIENETAAGMLILGVDPGRDKIGFAFCDYNKENQENQENNERELILSGIFLFHELENFLSILMRHNFNLNDFNIFQSWIKENFIKNYNLKNIKNIKNKNLDFVIALGNGTHSMKFYDKIKILNKKIIVVDEHGTTLEARKLYWKLHEPGFLKRLLPQSMRVPPRVVDDLAAWAVARRAVI